MEIKYEIEEEIGVLSEGNGGWQKEINMVSWNEHPAKFDIRDWNADHSRMRKGITLTADEIIELRSILNDLDLD